MRCESRFQNNLLFLSCFCFQIREELIIIFHVRKCKNADFYACCTIGQYLKDE